MSRELEKRNTLYYDVDGVLLDFTMTFGNYWNNGIIEGKWTGHKITENPTTWSFGYRSGIDDMSQLLIALDIFHEEHEHLPLLHPNIPDVLTKLQEKYNIELVTSYPNERKRIENLLHHEIPYDSLVCNVTDKINYIKDRENNGYPVIAIFEDGPHHINDFLPHYNGKIWSPSHWNYLKPFKHINGIRFYENPEEWMTLY